MNIYIYDSLNIYDKYLNIYMIIIFKNRSPQIWMGAAGSGNMREVGGKRLNDKNAVLLLQPVNEGPA